MNVFSDTAFDGHEQVVFASDTASGLKTIIAVHNTNLGPSLGGCRMWPYASEQEAIHDALRLSRGMTYKSALANLPLGGGKSVIIGDPRSQKTPELFRAMGRAVEQVGGRYIVAEDVGTSPADMEQIASQTEHVGGISDGKDPARTGDPSPFTAYGVFIGLKEAARFKNGHDDLTGMRVAVQGLGHVGYHLCQMLYDAGAKLVVADLNQASVTKAVDEFGAIAVSVESILSVDADILAPCALGGVINDRTLEKLHVGIIAGAANNQLEHARHGNMLREAGILYAPDYVINAGGVVEVHYCREGKPLSDTNKHIEGIGATVREIFDRAKLQNLSTSFVADRLAEERFGLRQLAA
ncbi:Glu/Leu/Phe/Val dehydrogenase dimerization domain-containing protein [Thalassospira lucentensis]|uniref:Glu/Leu/Phe/Val dehydrogenase dimerization domain-containing protein n=1 Tax=Thalassospira lucentensis TaxID=168935 RepID=UPI0003B58868|nr:Glu/Leu/Phe/Val dehydrogenase dimerization domain-containing protein [Thalassospira lucentensis]RCK27610.1 amino acid dehydrogenase [Thalassospira lucentensis MCCC 1A00383 = DSM 14000]